MGKEWRRGEVGEASNGQHVPGKSSKSFFSNSS